MKRGVDSGERSGGSRRRTLVVGSGLQAMAQVMLLVVNLALTPYVIAGFGPERFSIYLLVSSISLLMSTLDGGIGAAAQRFFTLYAGSGDVRARSRMLASLVAITTASTACIFPVVFIFAPRLTDFFYVEPQYQPETVFLLRSLIALTGVLIIRNLFNSLLFAHRRFVVTASAAMASHVLFAVGMIASVELDWGLYGVAGTLISVQVFVSAVNIPFALRLVDSRHLRWFGWPRLREFMGYAWKLQLSSFLTLISAQKDQLVAGRLLGAQASGPYGQGANLAGQLVRLPMNALSPMQSVIGQDVGRLGEQDSVRSAELLQRVWVRLSCVWLALGVPAVYVGVRAWLPESYALTGVIAPILMAGLFFHLMTTVLRLWCLTVGKAGLELETLTVAFFVNVGVSIGLYPVMGMVGVVLGTATSHAFGALYMQWRARSVVEQPLRTFWREIPYLTTLVLFIVTAAIELTAEPYLPSGFAGILTAGILALPSAVLAFFLLVPRAERQTAWRAVLRRR
ncbi:oligosaccharide flippase family protein [Serinicoccus sp. LYQ131]|uniref:oligosaccharide flippase family protein n=1 Tax=Serinicoccus sp. LYQ131 TaxID=3378797 RepID=UPI0038554056